MCRSVGSASHQNQQRSIDHLKLKFQARFRLEVQASGIPQKALAFDIGTDDAKVTRYLSDQYPDDLPLWRIPLVTASVGPGLMEFTAIQCGGTYHHGEHAPHCHESVMVLVGLLAKQSGAAVQQLLQDIDTHLTAAKDLPGLRRLKGTLEALIADVEGGES
jgi:hypothetical protein